MVQDQILREKHPDAEFKFSNGWFDSFKRCFNICLRRPTNKAQHTPADKQQLIRKFHQEIRQVAKSGEQISELGRFTSSSVANVDQTPLPFTFTDGPTYEAKGAKSVRVQGGTSGLDKRQCTIQLTLYLQMEYHE